MSAGDLCPWVSAQTLTVHSCYVYRDFRRFILLPSRSLLFPWLASWQAETGQTSSTQRDVLGKQDP